MIPLKLNLKNFTSYTNPPVLDFTQFKMAAISGSNGAGKSSLLDAITWCLWGVSRAGDSSDPLIHLGEEEMDVEFSFDLDGHTFSVKRRRVKKGGGSTTLEFWSNSHNLTEGTIKSTQLKIIQTLHLSFETFSNSAFLRQGHADEFTTQGPTDRKRILADILGLDHYDSLEDKAKEQIKNIQLELSRIDYQLPEIEAELIASEGSSTKKAETEERLHLLESEIKKLEFEIKNLSEEKANLNASASQQQKIRQSFTELKEELEKITNDGKQRSERIKQLKIDISELPSFEEKLKDLKNLQAESEKYNLVKQQKLETQNQLSLIQGSLNLKLQRKESLNKQLQDIQTQLTSLKKEGAKCPTCGQEIDKDQKHQALKTLEEKYSELEVEKNNIDSSSEEKEIDSIQKQIADLSLNDSQYQEIQDQIRRLEEIRLKREELIKKQASLETEEKVLFDLRSLFTSKKAQIDKVQSEIDKLPSLSESLGSVETNLEIKEEDLEKLRAEDRQNRSILGEIIGLISRVEQLGKLKSELEKKQKEFQKEREIYEELALAFGKKGIQAMIIETAIPEIEDESNRLLERLTEGRMKVRFDTQRETKTKVASIDGSKTFGTVETLDIIISDEMGERSYEMYSGGETFRVNFAIRLAISKLLTHRAGARLQFLVIDEGFGTQDAAGRSRLVEILDAIKNDFEKILVITHLEELKEEFPTRIEVSKTPSGSSFEIVNS